MSDLLGRRVLPEWAEAGPERWALIDEAADDEMWRVREQGRERLVQFVRERLRESALARGVSVSDVAWCDEVLDPEALTICFARRFATYKRANLAALPARAAARAAALDRSARCSSSSRARPTRPTTRARR